MELRVLVAHHCALYGEGLCSLLEKDPIIEVKSAKGDWLETLKIAKDFRPHVIVMPLGIPATIRSLLFSALHEEILGVRILLLAPQGKEDDIVHALRNGAHGYVPLDASREEFLNAVKGIAKKEYWTQRSLIKHLVKYPPQGLLNGRKKKIVHPDEWHSLSKKDKEVSLLLSEGISEKAIAHRLGISVAAVHKHLTKIFKFFGVSTRSMAIARLLRPE